jgi:hypothetical protein
VNLPFFIPFFLQLPFLIQHQNLLSTKRQSLNYSLTHVVATEKIKFSSIKSYFLQTNQPLETKKSVRNAFKSRLSETFFLR